MEMHFDDPSRDIFVIGLDSDEDLFHLAGRFGVVLQVRIVRDAAGHSRGFGFARYAHPSDAAKGREGLDGLRIRSRVLRAKPVTRQPSPGRPVPIPKEKPQ